MIPSLVHSLLSLSVMTDASRVRSPHVSCPHTWRTVAEIDQDPMCELQTHNGAAVQLAGPQVYRSSDLLNVFLPSSTDAAVLQLILHLPPVSTILDLPPQLPPHNLQSFFFPDLKVLFSL